MAFRACCCLKPKSGAVLVAIFDLLIGVSALVGVGFLFYELFTQDSEHKSIGVNRETSGLDNWPKLNSPDEFFGWYHALISNWQVALSYLAPALTTTILGVLLIFAACNTDSIMGTLAFVLNLILILGSFVDIGVMYFIVEPHIATLAPILISALIQMYLIWALQDFRSADLKTEVDE